MIQPDLEELLALRGTAQALTLHTRGRARGPLLGGHQSVHRGRGLEFQEVRAYVAGDDPRNIDWRVTARRGRPHTKLFREERERPVWLLVDLHAGMFFGTRRQLKSALAVRAAALLGWVAARGGDRVGAVVARDSSHRIVPARSRDAGVLPVLAALLEMQPTAPGPTSADSLGGALQALAPLIRPGSVVLTISDFAIPDSTAGPLWSALAAHSEFKLFWITDPLEEQGLPNGHFRAGWLNRAVTLDGGSVRQHWLETWRKREARVDELARRLAAPVTRLDTRNSMEDVLRPLLRGRPTAA